MEFRANVGNVAENEVQAAVEAAFSPDFVFRSPRHEGGREVTDVLVLFDDVGLVIQSKAQAVGIAPTSADPREWAAKNLDKAGRQVGGAIRALRSGRVRFVENARRGRVPFDVRDFPYLYGLIVLHHESEPYEPFELAPSLRGVKAPVTVLSFRDFWNLSELLDTPPDLINYLEHRPQVLVPTLSPKVHKEAQVFGYYIERLEDVMKIQARQQGRPLPTNDARLYAQELRKIVKGEHPDHESGVLIDHMIDKIHDVDPDLRFFDAGGRGFLSTDKSAYVQVATELAKIPRIRRIALGARFLRTARLAAETGHDRHVVTHSARRSDCIVFVASPSGPSERSDRAEYLLALTALAKAYHQVYRAIGVATEAGRPGRSYDMVLMESHPVPNAEIEELGREMFGETSRPLVRP